MHSSYTHKNSNIGVPRENLAVSDLKPNMNDSVNSSQALPIESAGVTSEWCSTILGRPIRNVTFLDAIHGTASKLLLEVTEDTAGGVPKAWRLCVKGGFDPKFIAMFPDLNAFYRREVDFYRHVAPLVDMRLPQTYYCGSDTVSGQGIVAMEDLSDRGCTFGDPTKAWPVERVRAGVEQLAALHAKTWNATAERFPWLSSDGPLGSSPIRNMLRAVFAPASWDARFAEGARPPVPDYMTDRERMTAAFERLWMRPDTKFSCVVHGDAHIGNTFITAAGEPGFIDWQGLHTCSAFHDVAYFVIGALDIEDRRQHEESIVSHYLATLSSRGGPELQWAEIWDDYRKHVLHGFVWSLSDPQMQPKEYVYAMTKRYVAAIEDHKSLELVESMA